MKNEMAKDLGILALAGVFGYVVVAYGGHAANAVGDIAAQAGQNIKQASLNILPPSPKYDDLTP